MRRKNLLVAFGSLFLDQPPWIAYGLLVVLGQLCLSVPLALGVMSTKLPMASQPGVYVVIAALGLILSGITAIGVRATRASYARQMEVFRIQHMQLYLSMPETLSIILGSYTGLYSVGITKDPMSGDLAFHLHIAGEDTMDIPSSVVVDGEVTRVIVQTGF